jgi:hypothetical protein
VSVQVAGDTEDRKGDEHTAHWGMLLSCAEATEAKATIEAIAKVFMLMFWFIADGRIWRKSSNYVSLMLASHALRRVAGQWLYVNLYNDNKLQGVAPHYPGAAPPG